MYAVNKEIIGGFVRDIRAFRIEQWSDFTGVIKS